MTDNKIIPKFAVGEEVLLRSKSRPEYDCECAVDGIIFSGDEYVCRVSGQALDVNFTEYQFGYILSNKLTRDSGSEFIWAETALRKKHQPGNMSYEALMSSLKLGAPVKI